MCFDYRYAQKPNFPNGSGALTAWGHKQQNVVFCRKIPLGGLLIVVSESDFVRKAECTNNVFLFQGLLQISPEIAEILA